MLKGLRQAVSMGGRREWVSGFVLDAERTDRADMEYHISGYSPEPDEAEEWEREWGPRLPEGYVCYSVLLKLFRLDLSLDLCLDGAGGGYVDCSAEYNTNERWWDGSGIHMGGLYFEEEG